MNAMRLGLPLTVLGVLLMTGCKDDDLDASGTQEHGEACLPGDESEQTCKDGLRCEPIGRDAGTHVCSAPLEIRGAVYDAFDGEPIVGARVAALDETGAPASDVAITDATGHYVLAVSARRDETGAITEALRWTLFVTAHDYMVFPEGVRPALPINAQEAVPEGEDPEDPAVLRFIDNPTTHVALIPLEGDDRTGITVSGSVHAETPGGTMVVAEGGSGRTSYTIADTSGTYTLFNVSTGATSIRGYRWGLELEPASISAGEGDLEGVDLHATTEDSSAMASVSGTINIVDAPGDSVTTVVLVPASLFSPALERGPVPFGLRDPDPPLAPDLQSAYRLDGVPAGTYKILPAFENDFLVRDPDTSIAGTDIVEIDVSAGEEVQISEAFKVTEALAVISPGAEVPEIVTGTPEFVWATDASETHYEVVVFDALGEIVWEDLNVPAVTGSPEVRVSYGGEALERGMYYQFRATSMRETPTTLSAISRTEDLRGVFVYDPVPENEDE
jgi:hypothetical protein